MGKLALGRQSHESRQILAPIPVSVRRFSGHFRFL
jgi:hypothetical protein